MYPFGHQGTSFGGERYYNTNYCAPSWNGYQNQYDDQYYYDEGCYQEGYQQENFDPQRYQAMPQNTTQPSNLETMLLNFLQQQKELQAVIEKNIQGFDRLKESVEQIKISQGLLKEKLEEQAIAATEKIMNERVEMEMISHREVQVYEAGIYSNLLSVAVEDDLDISMTSDLPVETEQYVESKEESCEDLADAYPCATKEDPLENLNVAVKSECEVWKPSFPVVEYARRTLAGAEYEDVYLSAPPPDKFRQFFPYILELPKGKSHDPIIHVEAYILKGSRPYFHFILHGRRFKWDLKVD